MNINKFLARTVHFIDDGHLALRKRIVCADGFSLSVQASEFHYCWPRGNFGPYDSVEVGYPSEDVPELEEYEDGDVYGWVPVGIVEALIEAHGGVKKGHLVQSWEAFIEENNA